MGLGMFRRRAADGGGKAAGAGETAVEVSAACVSDVGRNRSHNEDSFGEDGKLGLWVVADGMGGHEAGEIASDLAVSHIFRLVADGMSVAEAVSTAHDLIRRAPSQGIGSPGMGTTVVAAQLTGRNYRIYWVGDSRAYVHGSDGLKRLTADHSYVQQLLDSGVITAEEAEVHPERSVITQCLGAEGLPGVQVGEAAGELYDGDVLLLCSDGLTGEVSEADMAAVLGEETPLREKAQRLIDTANANGGSDNITVALIPAPAEAGPKPVVTATRKIRSIPAGTSFVARKRRRVVGWAVGAVLVAAIATAGWHWGEQVVKHAKPIISYVRELVGPDSEEEAPESPSSTEGLQEKAEAKNDESSREREESTAPGGKVDEESERIPAVPPPGQKKPGGSSGDTDDPGETSKVL